MSLQDGVDDSPDLLAEDQETRQVRRNMSVVKCANRHSYHFEKKKSANSETESTRQLSVCSFCPKLKECAHLD